MEGSTIYFESERNDYAYDRIWMKINAKLLPQPYYHFYYFFIYTFCFLSLPINSLGWNLLHGREHVPTIILNVVKVTLLFYT